MFEACFLKPRNCIPASPFIEIEALIIKIGVDSRWYPHVALSYKIPFCTKLSSGSPSRNQDVKLPVFSNSSLLSWNRKPILCCPELSFSKHLPRQPSSLDPSDLVLKSSMQDSKQFWIILLTAYDTIVSFVIKTKVAIVLGSSREWVIGQQVYANEADNI
jgi:hypothetical protein